MMLAPACIDDLIGQLLERGVCEPRLLDAVRGVPREAFAPPDLAHLAFDDVALPFGEGQTIPQPSMVALGIQALDLEPSDHVLEIGTGAGYGAALLACLAGQVYTVERVPALAARARAFLRTLGLRNVEVVLGDGSLGLPEHGPYDAIMVTAGAPRVPSALLRQLDPAGRMVIPVGRKPNEQRLLRIEKVGHELVRQQDLGPVRYAPLIGEQGWGSGTLWTC